MEESRKSWTEEKLWIPPESEIGEMSENLVSKIKLLKFL